MSEGKRMDVRIGLRSEVQVTREYFVLDFCTYCRLSLGTGTQGVLLSLH